MTTVHHYSDCSDPDQCYDHPYSEYVLIIDETEFLELGDAVESKLEEAGLDVEVRAPRRGEAAGTYGRKNDGTLQILGYSIEVPEDVNEAIQAAWNAACAGN